ncbi:tryptophan synthase beta subunit-like PLP-dependent enzyme [Poronia punctata]|nr:tryptophan synthase beta subunit-like PLP-dependent enzyme [Poronia punctata]
MSVHVPQEPKLFIETPCIPSRELSQIAGCNIFLKLENLQPSGSFKSRGIGTMMSRSLRASPRGRAHFYCSSGGNAGLACAEAARTLRQPCDVYLPSSAPELVLEKLARLGATAHRAGSIWPEADAVCRAVAEADMDGVYVPPFDHEWIWEGASTLVDELVSSSSSSSSSSSAGNGNGNEIDAIVCNVGGGGLLNGVMRGIQRNYPSAEKPKPAVLALETEGAHSLAASIRAGTHVTLPGITSIATTLGAPRVSAETYRWAELYKATTFTFPFAAPSLTPPLTPDASLTQAFIPTALVSAVVPDSLAVSACTRFLDDERLLVEISCGATLASAYNPAILRAAFGAGLDDEAWARKNVVMIVCGGSSISTEMLAKYKVSYGV